MRKNYAILVLLVFNVVLYSNSGFACSCEPPGSPSEELDARDAVFAGTVIEITLDTLNTDEVVYRVRFVVQEVWKGVDEKEIIVTTLLTTAECGFPFEPDTSYLVYAFFWPAYNSLFAHLCSRTKELSYAEEDLQELGSGIMGIHEDLEARSNPQQYCLLQNYPNPFNPVTTIAYDLPQASDVTLTIYTITGQKVATVMSGHQEAGHYTAVWDGSGFAPGIYLYRLEAGSFADTRKLLLLR